jgi:hypothetical protein
VQIIGKLRQPRGICELKRLLTMFLSLLLLAWLAPAAGAHNLSTTAAFSLSGDELTVRFIDVYGAAVEGGKATASAAAPGKKGAPAPLTEVQPGTYRGTVAAPASGEYDILVEITVFKELFRGSIRVLAGDDMAETLVPMVPIDPPLAHSIWGPVLYGAAALVLIVATVVALRKSRGGEEVEE